MTGVADLWAYRGAVQVAAPANTARNSRRPMPPDFLSDANALEQAIVMLYQLPFVGLEVIRDNRKIADGLRETSAGKQ
jgi:hypothetical protein